MRNAHVLIQQAALKAVMMMLAEAGLEVRLGSIGTGALEQADKWPLMPDRRLKWDWRQIVAGYRNDTKRVEVAIWAGNLLCGLDIGRVRPSYVSLDYLEGHPDPKHPLKGGIIVIALTVLRALAQAHGRPNMRLIEPLPELVDLYRGFGFDYHQPKSEPSYCEMKL